jgi:hypothetical protein
MTLRLIDLEAPLEDVEFPNGTKHIPVPFGPTHYAKWREIQESKDSDERWKKLVEIAKACYPTANVYDWDSITSATMLIALVGHAGGRIDRVKEALKNVEALAATMKEKEEKKEPPDDEPPAPTTVNTTLPLSPKTSGALSAPILPELSEETSGTTTGPVATTDPS